MKKNNIIKMLMLALSVSIFVPIWGTFHAYIGINNAWVAFVSAAVFFAAGHNIREVVKVSLSHILGMFWGLAVLYIIDASLLNINVILYMFIVLAIFGFASVLITNIGISLVSHTPSLFAGWAVAFVVFDGMPISEWKGSCLDVGLALVIGVWFVGVGISQFQMLLIKVLKIDDEDTELAENRNEQENILHKNSKSKAESKLDLYIASYSKPNENSQQETTNADIDEIKSGIADLKHTILDTQQFANNLHSQQSINDVKVKILGICGSPHKNGSTINYLKRALAAAEEMGNVEVELIELAGKDIKPCLGCKSDKCGGTCRINDYMQELYPKLRECDGMILASPSYFGTFTGQLKLFLDRLRVMRHSNFELGNKVVGTLAVAGRRHGGQEITNIDLIQSMMRHNTIIVNDGTAVCQLGATGWSHTFDDPTIKSEDDDYGMQTAVGVGKRVAEIAKVIKGSGLQNVTYQYNQKIGKR